MTVRVRQLTRTTAGRFPPQPPPPSTPVMVFIQQPTDTQVGDPFHPPITVGISTGANDSLTIYSYSGCAFTPTTITAVNGTGTFTGLIAQTVGMGCRFGVHNNSNPDIIDIVSEPFNVTAPPVSDWELVSRGSVPGFDNGLRTEGLTLDSTGTTDAFALTSTFNFSTYEMVDTRGNVWTVVSSIPLLGGLLLLWRAASNPDNPPSFAPILGITGTLYFYSQFPAMAVYNFSRQTTGTGVIAGSPYFNSLVNVNTIGPIGSMTIPFTNSLVITGYTDNDWTTPTITEPAGYIGREYVAIGGFRNGNLLGAYKILDSPSVENPIWVTSGNGSPAMIMGAFEA